MDDEYRETIALIRELEALLASPAKVVPNTAEALPAVADNGRTWTIRVKRGIFFTDDPAFKGKPRELVAADYAYTYKRILDPAVKSPWLWLLEGKVVGSDAARAAAATRTATPTITQR